MKNTILLSVVVFCIATFACKSKPNKNETKMINNDSTTFYPLSDMLKNELVYLKKNPFYIYKTTQVNNGKVDSIPFSYESLNTLFQTLIELNIDTAGKKEFYTENSFQDLSTKSISIVYITTNDKMKVNQLTVLLNDETNAIKNAFIKTASKEKEAYFSTQYNWKAGKSLTITTIKKDNTGKETIIKEFINWNDYNR